MKFRALMLIAALLSPIGLVSCSAPVSVQTPAGQAAFHADQAVQSISALQDAVIQANGQKLIGDATAVAVVKSTRAMIITIGQSPSGWKATVTTGWAETKRLLSPAETARFQTLITAVDVALSVIGSAS